MAEKPAAAAKKKKKAKISPKGLTAFTEQGSVPRWLTAARIVLVLALAATLPTIVGVSEGRRLFWAAAIASLPLFWVLGGYHLWRRICPLAVFAQLGRFLGIAGKRRITGRVANNYMLLQLGLMVVALSLRLTMTNGTKLALVGFLAAVVVVAVITGMIWTGKTWCNYICPVGMVEKFYTEPIRLAGPTDSKCKPCTACKKNCPDIDLEQHYWKELESPARRTAYFSWPGLVFGFYGYYYLVRGNWDYYFSGDWTRENEQIGWLLEPGFHFLSAIPVAVAAPITLIACAAISFVVFSLGEQFALRWTSARDVADQSEGESAAELVRHRALAVAGFVAFIAFYWFGGQPTIRQLPGWFGEAFAVVVVVAASAIFFRRWRRKQAEFVKERFAEKLLKRWKWGDAPASDNLSDIYLVHSERTKERESRLLAYKETVREMVADGLVTKSELVILDSLRGQLGVTDSDHKRLLGELSDEERQLFDPDYQGSVELRLQQQQYQQALTRVVIASAHGGQKPAPESLAGLRAEYQVSRDEEATTMAELAGPGGALSTLYHEQVDAVRVLAQAHQAALTERTNTGGVGSSSYDFFRSLLQLRAGGRIKTALELLTPLADGAAGLASSIALLDDDDEARSQSEAALRSAVGDELAEPLIASTSMLATDDPIADVESVAPFLALRNDSSSALRATTVHLLSRFDDDLAKAAVVAATDDQDALVREAAFNALGTRGRLNRVLMGKALADSDPRVKEAAKGTARRFGSADSTDDALEAAASSETRGIFATLDAGRRMEALTSLEKMMLLHQVPLFHSLAPGELEELSEIADEQRFDEGALVCREGEEADDVYLIISGKLEIFTMGEDGHREVLGTVGSGSCIGEMAVLDSAPRSASVKAIEKSRALVLDGSDFKSMLATRPIMANGIIRELVGRLRGMIADRQPSTRA